MESLYSFLHVFPNLWKGSSVSNLHCVGPKLKSLRPMSQVYELVIQYGGFFLVDKY